MKKLKIYGGLLLSLLFLVIAGCKKDQTAMPLPTISITTLPQGNGIVTVAWISSNATGVTLAINGGNPQKVDLSGSVSSNKPTTYLFTATGPGGQVTETKNNEIVSSLQVSADSTNIVYGGKANITVTTQCIDSVISDLPGFHGTNGTFPTPSLNATTTYHFVAYYMGQKMGNDSITITVGYPAYQIALCQPMGWKWIQRWTRYDQQNPWSWFQLDSVALDMLTFYNLNGTGETYLMSNRQMIGNGVYTIYNTPQISDHWLS